MTIFIRVAAVAACVLTIMSCGRPASEIDVAPGQALVETLGDMQGDIGDTSLGKGNSADAAGSEDGWTDIVPDMDACLACLEVSPTTGDTGDTSPSETSVPTDAEGADAGNGYNQATGNAPIPKLLPWPPACENPKSKSQNINGEPSCWDPPNGSCAGSDAASVHPACSAEGDYCCVFSSSCIPCDWVNCAGCPTGEDCPDVCKAQKWPYTDENNASIWYSEKCVLLQTILAKCATCGADIHCPWVK